MKRFVVTWGALLLAFGAQALEVRDAYVRGLPPGQKNTAAFLELYNPGAEAVTLVAGSSDAAERVEIHGHQQRDGMMAMRRQDSVTVAAHDSLRFAPGGLHVMLIELTRPLAEGDQVRFTLITQGGEELEVVAPVISVLNAPNKLHQHQEHH